MTAEDDELVDRMIELKDSRIDVNDNIVSRSDIETSGTQINDNIILRSNIRSSSVGTQQGNHQDGKKTSTRRHVSSTWHW